MPVVLLTAVLVVSGCSEDVRVADAATVARTTPVAAYDGAGPPASAVLRLVPEDVETVTVTDFDQVRAELGVELGPGSTPADVAASWQRATAERPLLTPGMLRPDDDRLAAAYGFTQVDVAWEAHLYGAGDEERGWVLRFHDSTDMAQVERATADPASPLRGGTVDAAHHLVTSGTTDQPAQSWAADPATTALVVTPANATYLARGCSPDVPTADVEELEAWSVAFEGGLVTARLGADRTDLFTQMRLGATEPAFTAAFDGGVADPLTGRIGYVMTDPPAAARLALEHRLPFAACP